MHRLRARLEHEELPGLAVLPPLDVHRRIGAPLARVVFFDLQRPAGELQHVLVGDGGLPAQLGRHRRQRRPALAVDHPLLLAPDGLPDQGPETLPQRVLVHIELVRHHLALDDGLAQPVARGNQHHAAVAGLGVQREEDPRCRAVAAHHLLHAHAEGHVMMIEPHARAVADRARGEERREAALDRIEQRALPAHVQVGVLLSGEARSRQVLGRRRRADRHVRLRRSGLLRERRIGRDRFVRDLVGQVRGADQLADLRAPVDQALDVAFADAGEELADATVEARRRDEVPVGVRGDRKPVRYAHAERHELPDHLSERCDLAADESDVGKADFGKPPHEAHGNASPVPSYARMPLRGNPSGTRGDQELHPGERFLELRLGGSKRETRVAPES